MRDRDNNLVNFRFDMGIEKLDNHISINLIEETEIVGLKLNIFDSEHILPEHAKTQLIVIVEKLFEIIDQSNILWADVQEHSLLFLVYGVVNIVNSSNELFNFLDIFRVLKHNVHDKLLSKPPKYKFLPPLRKVSDRELYEYSEIIMVFNWQFLSTFEH